MSNLKITVQGIGKMLFDAAQQFLIKADHKDMIVGVMTPTSVGFYEKMGMSVFDEKLIKTGVFAGTRYFSYQSRQ